MRSVFRLLHIAGSIQLAPNSTRSAQSLPLWQSSFVALPWGAVVSYARESCSTALAICCCLECLIIVEFFLISVNSAELLCYRIHWCLREHFTQALHQPIGLSRVQVKLLSGFLGLVLLTAHDDALIAQDAEVMHA